MLRPDRPDGSALILAPGGGYARQMLDFEGMDVGRHFNARGVTCFVLRYRLPGEGWANRSDVPLQDAQRAVRLVRANASRFGVDASRIGFMGFSAGGHVACSIATRFAAKVYEPLDAADGLSARPDFSAPMYPVVTMGEGCHAGSRDNLLGPNPPAELIDAYSCQRHVPADAPPSWLCLAADDTTVPPLPNAGAYYAALQAAKIPSEIHVFETGGHGFGIARTVGKPDAIWPELFTTGARGTDISKLSGGAFAHKGQGVAQHADACAVAHGLFTQMATEQPRTGAAIVKPQHGLDQAMQPCALRQGALNMIAIGVHCRIQIDRRAAEEAASTSTSMAGF